MGAHTASLVLPKVQIESAKILLRDLIIQKIKEGLESARARGRKGGRPKIKDSRISKALKLYESKEYSISEIVGMTGVS